MKARKLIKWSLIIVVLAAALGAIVLYRCSMAVPEAYQPPELSNDQREEVARRFMLKIQEFGNFTQKNEPFDWTISQEEINDALASLDEIAATTAQEGKSPEVRRMMDKVGVSAPAVSLRKGLLTLMLHSRDLGKVVSADLAMTMTPDHAMRVQLAGARVGYVPVPESVVQKGMEKLKAGLAHKNAQTRPSSQMLYAGLSYDDISGIMGQVLTAINGEPMSTEHTWPINKRHFRIEGVNIAGGNMTLHVVPISKRTQPTP